jgi:urease accessory protein
MALRATSFRRAEPLGDEPFGIVVLDADERHIRRKRITLANGEDILVDFEKPVHLEQGDLLVLDPPNRSAIASSMGSAAGNLKRAVMRGISAVLPR